MLKHKRHYPPVTYSSYTCHPMAAEQKVWKNKEADYIYSTFVFQLEISVVAIILAHREAWLFTIIHINVKKDAASAL